MIKKCSYKLSSHIKRCNRIEGEKMDVISQRSQKRSTYCVTGRHDHINERKLKKKRKHHWYTYTITKILTQPDGISHNQKQEGPNPVPLSNHAIYAIRNERSHWPIATGKSIAKTENTDKHIDIEISVDRLKQAKKKKHER
jgi:hypothetical protein